jgi:hypothetical protein
MDPATYFGILEEAQRCPLRAKREHSYRLAFARRNTTSSLDHLVGAGKQHRWNVDAERLGGPEVDHQLELDRLRDG